MKTYLFTALLLGTVTMASAQGTATIRGQVKGLGTTNKVYLYDVDTPDNSVALDSAQVSADGSFTLRQPLRRPRLCSLSFYKKLAKPTRQGDTQRRVARLPLLLDGKDDVTLTTDTATLLDGRRSDGDALLATQLTGGKTLTDYLAYRRYITAQEDSADQAGYREADAYFKYYGDKSKYAALIARKGQEAARLDSMKTAWLMQNATTATAAYLLAQRYYQDYAYTVPQLERWIAACTADGAADTARVGWLRRNAAIVKSLALGIQYHDIGGMKKDGTHTTLAALMQPGKYTLIDFWASWCGPCRAAIPKVKRLYADKKDKLVVVSASVDSKKADWLKAEQQEAMPWPQLWLTGDDMKRAGEDYAIRSIPRLVLIGPDGSIRKVTFDPDEVIKML